MWIDYMHLRQSRHELGAVHRQQQAGSTIMVTREVAWGDALLPKIFRHPGGLNACVDTIRQELGPIIGVRNTFAKLLQAGGPEELKGADQFRAWLLLVSLGEDPSAWGVSDGIIPAGYDKERLRAALWAPRGSNPQPTVSGVRRLASVPA